MIAIVIDLAAYRCERQREQDMDFARWWFLSCFFGPVWAAGLVAMSKAIPQGTGQ